jgi:hypothetical protein
VLDYIPTYTIILVTVYEHNGNVLLECKDRKNACRKINEVNRFLVKDKNYFAIEKSLPTVSLHKRNAGNFNHIG